MGMTRRGLDQAKLRPLVILGPRRALNPPLCFALAIPRPPSAEHCPEDCPERHKTAPQSARQLAAKRMRTILASRAPIEPRYDDAEFCGSGGLGQGKEAFNTGQL